MTKANITQYDSTPSNNADINDINIAENCPASNINNAIRELMAHLKNVDTGSQALTALSVTGIVTVAGDIQKTSGNLTIDVDGQLIVNSDSGQIVLQDDTVNWGNLQNSSGDFIIGSLGTDKDIKIQGLDGSSTIDALTFDMSDAGTASFNNKVLLGGSSMDLGFGSQQLSVRTTGGTSPAIFGSTHDTTTTLIAYASGSSYAGIVQDIRIGRAVSNAYGALVVKANASSSVDTIFYLRGDGNAFADNNWNAGGADYAEYFEWSDGNSDNEDRRGYTVVLDGDKIRKSTSEDNATTIIGVISDNPSVVGNNAWDSWSDKYQKDDYASYILNENGERIMNEDFDDTQEYVSRENRTEWDIVGLMGRIRVRVGQTIGDRWIKMREISDTVHEYLVR